MQYWKYKVALLNKEFSDEDKSLYRWSKAHVEVRYALFGSNVTNACAWWDANELQYADRFRNENTNTYLPRLNAST